MKLTNGYLKNDTYAKSLRQQYMLQMQFQDYPRTSLILEDSTTSQLYRRMKFLPKQMPISKQTYTGISRLEQYIQATRSNLCINLPEIIASTHYNMSKNEHNFLNKLKLNQTEIL